MAAGRHPLGVLLSRRHRTNRRRRLVAALTLKNTRPNEETPDADPAPA